ncbi:MAG: ATP phosphoribosyltransferase [Planctomycetes bacterium]|nr:ATP phosphoribosyltransferase [Planctomycetota bacterium]
MADSSLELLRRAGYAVEAPAGRLLSARDPEQRIEVFLAKRPHVPTYVSYGIADVGIVGEDVLRESSPDVLELLDLKLGACRLVLAAPRERAGTPPRPSAEGAVRVATKYPEIARAHFARRGVPVEIVRLSGSIEIAPELGLAPYVLDIVETGSTLEAHGLAIVEEVQRSTARLIANRARWALEHAALRGFARALEEAVRASSA